MAVFAVQYAYVDRPEALTEVRPRHREFLAELLAAGTLLASGPYVSGPDSAWAGAGRVGDEAADPAGAHEKGPAEEGPGALLLVRAETAEAAAALLEEDPFFVAGLIEGRGVRGWLPVMGPLTP